MNTDIVSKTTFANLTGVTQACVSRWLASGKLDGDAIVGEGPRARIRVKAAQEQLRARLDPVQHFGANGRAKIDGESAPLPHATATVEDGIKAARLAQLELSNEKAAAEAAARSGRYITTDDARQEMGRVAARLMSVFESSFSELANALAASPQKTSRDILRTLRATWREIRIRQAKARSEEAAALPPLIDEPPDASRER